MFRDTFLATAVIVLAVPAWSAAAILLQATSSPLPQGDLVQWQISAVGTAGENLNTFSQVSIVPEGPGLGVHNVWPAASNTPTPWRTDPSPDFDASWAQYDTYFKFAGAADLVLDLGTPFSESNNNATTGTLGLLSGFGPPLSGFGTYSSAASSTKVLLPQKSGSTVNFMQVVLKAGESAFLDVEVVGNAGTVSRYFDNFRIGGVTQPPLAVDAELGDKLQGSIVGHTFSTSVGDSPITWDNLMVSGPGVPANPPALTSEGVFTWDSAGSPAGLYNFDVTAINSGGSDMGRLSINLIEPPPVPPLVIDANLGDRTQGNEVFHHFTTSAGDLPIAWSDLVLSGPAIPLSAPTLSAGGAFQWNTAGSPLGLYNFDVMATNSGGSDIGRLSINLVAPYSEPPVVEDSTIVALPSAVITHLISAYDPDTEVTELTWTNVTFEGLEATIQPQFDSATQVFTWDTTGSPVGIYEFRVTASDTVGGSDIGRLLIGLGVELPSDADGGDVDIPEPATICLAGLAILLVLGRIRHGC
jgi:hypothetical protein